MEESGGVGDLSSMGDVDGEFEDKNLFFMTLCLRIRSQTRVFHRTSSFSVVWVVLLELWVQVRAENLK